jgi:hypothetical protein
VDGVTAAEESAVPGELPEGGAIAEDGDVARAGVVRAGAGAGLDPAGLAVWCAEPGAGGD